MPDENEVVNGDLTVKQRLSTLLSKRFIGSVVISWLSTMVFFKTLPMMLTDNTRLILIGIYFGLLATVWGYYNYINLLKDKLFNRR